MNVEIVNYIKNVINYRLSLVSGQDEVEEFPTFDFSNDDSEFSKFVTAHVFTTHEIIILLLALLPHITPGYITNILSEHFPDGSEFPEFGGIKGTQYRGIIPTGETALYILAGNNIQERIKLAVIFDEKHIFHKKGILVLGSVPVGEPKLSGKLIFDQEYVDLFLYGYISKPKLSQDFPAQLLETKMAWDDLVLQEKTLEEVNDLLIWLQYNPTLLNDYGLKHKIKPGYRVMFFGAPGVGKTLTASLLGKHTKRDVYRIDLSLVVSKYIGETEKNLSKLFNKAQNKDWILFFDEADAIFGKRTGVRDAHDKYANQEVSFLLQRIEAHPGLVILASNYRSNIDKAFTRRFQSIIEFQTPNTEERRILWEKYIPTTFMNDALDLDAIAQKYEVTGANIVNIIQHACLHTLEQKQTKLTKKTLLEAIRKEFIKEGKMV